MAQGSAAFPCALCLPQGPWGPSTEGQWKSSGANCTLGPGNHHAPVGTQPRPVLETGGLQPPLGLSPSASSAPLPGLVGEGSLVPPGLTLSWSPALHFQSVPWDSLNLRTPLPYWITFPHVQLTRSALPWVVASVDTPRLTSLSSVFHGPLLPISSPYACCFLCLNTPLHIPPSDSLPFFRSQMWPLLMSPTQGRGCSWYHFKLHSGLSLDRRCFVQNDYFFDFYWWGGYGSLH